MSEVNKSDWDVASNPIIGYADSYRHMARTGTTSVDVWSIITDLERNMAPLMTATQSELAALREELATAQRGLANCKLALDAQTHNYSVTNLRLTAAEQRNAELAKLLNGYPRGVPGFAAWADKVTSALKPTESGASE